VIDKKKIEIYFQNWTICYLIIDFRRRLANRLQILRKTKIKVRMNLNFGKVRLLQSEIDKKIKKEG
jgi:hypothetical protein